MSSAHAQRRKHTAKRPLLCSDEEDEPPNTKRPRTADADAPLSISTTPGVQGDMDVDIDIDSAPHSLSASDSGNTDSPRALSKKRRKSVSKVTTRKKPQIMHSGDEESDSPDDDPVEDDLSDPPIPISDDDEEFGSDTPPRRGTKGKAGAAKAKGRKGRAGQPKGTKKNTKDKDKDKEIYVKDERRPNIPSTTTTTSRASSAAAQSGPSDLFANEDVEPLSAVEPVPDAVRDPLSQAIPKKRKLPPIKKTKTAASGAGTSAPAATTAQRPPAVQERSKPALPTSEQRKQALTGVRDIDLGDSKVYAELFKGAGGITPRSGLKNAEERRKELDKMRDEARARRAEEGKFTFDLQRQADKIARFEQRLRAENSTVLHPNFLAAKMRDEWELDRHNRRATPKGEGEA